MAHFSIISSQGQHPVLFTGTPRYVGAYLKPGYLEFPEIGAPTAINWHVGDYVVYSRTGRTYRLYGTPQAVERARSNRYGAAFLYENVQFFDDVKQLELCPFSDLVPGDNMVHFSTQGTISFFGKPSNVAERIQACLENQYGSGSWAVKVVTTSDADLLEILNTEVEFSVSGVNCLEVLDKVYETWNNLGWSYTIENGKNTITIGEPNNRTAANTTEPYSFGNGLIRVEKSIANANDLGTRLFAYGSMKNMDATYYRGLDIYNAESVDIEHLMIPVANWGTTDSKPDARKAFIQDAAAVANLGLIPRTAYFDGTGDLPDIHPTIEQMTIGEVYDAGGAGYVPSLSKWSRDQRIDEIVSATNPSDQGAASDMGRKLNETISSLLFEVSVENTEGNIRQQIWGDTITKSGRMVIKFGRNPISFTTMSGWTNPVFSNILLEVYGQWGAEYIPLSVTQESTNVWHISLPQSVTVQNAVAGPVNLYISGYVLRASDDTYSNYRTYTFATDPDTSLDLGVEYTIGKTFSVRIPQIGFDIEQYASLGASKTLSMKTGMCAGRDFEIKSAAYQSDTDSWQLTLYRSNDEDLNILFPNADYQIVAGDQFVLLDIAMPEMYVTVASNRLLAAAQKLLSDICAEKPFYAPQIDAKVVFNESRLLLEGLWMDISFNGVQQYAIIDSITIDENGSNIPTYEVALREKKGVDWTENIGSSSSGKSSVSVSGNDAQVSNGTVTSVGLTAPTGLEVVGSPITSSGVIKLQLAPGYKIPLESELSGYFEIGSLPALVQLKSAYSYFGARDGLFFTGGDTAGPVPDIYVDTVQDSGGNPVRVLRTPLAFISDGDQIIGDGTPGSGGGGGGVTNLYQLDDVFGDTSVRREDGTAKHTGDVLAYSGSLDKWVAAPVVQSVAGQTGAVTASQIATALTSAGYKLTDTVITDYWKTGDTRVKNTVLAAPNGSNGAATFRALVPADIPSLAISKITNLQTSLNAKQDTISDLDTIRSNASAGVAAYNALGNYVLKAGDTMTGDLIISKTGGGNLILRGTEANHDGGTLYFYGRYYSGNPRNGAKIAAVYPGSGALYDIQDLVFSVSRNRTDATPTWEEAMRIASTKAVSITDSLSVGTTLSVTGLATLSGGATIPVNKKLTIGDAEIEWIPNSGNGYLRINKPLLTVGDQIVNSGTPGGGGGGGGASSLFELADVLTDANKTNVKQYDGTTNAANGNMFAFNGSKWYALKLGTNLSITNGTLNATDTTYSNGTGLALSNGVFSITSAYQTNIANGASAYSTLTTSQTKNKVLASPSSASGAPSFRALVAADIPSLTVSKISDLDTNYVSIASAQTVSAKHTFSAGLLLNTASSWSNTDRALFFSASDEMANLRYYSTDASKGLMFNPYSGALKAGSFVKLGGGSGFLKADGSEDTTAYLPLSGGTMTGDIKMTNGEYINAESGYAMLGIGSGGTNFYCGPGAEITGSFLIRSGNIDLTHVKAGQNYKVWDASNSNLSTVDWAAKNLSVAGTSTFSDTMYVENRKYMQWKDSGGTYRNIFGLNNSDNLLIGYGLSSVTGSVTTIYGETVRLQAADINEIVKTGGATLVMRGTQLNNQVHTILFRGSDSESNGFKIQTTAASTYGRQSLGFYRSNATPSSAPYTPDWKRSLYIPYDGGVIVGTSSDACNLTVYGSITSSGDQVISSDATKKKNWRDLKYGVADIAKATAGVFDWKDGKGESAGTKAQDWMHLVPQLVHGEEGHMTLAYGQIAMLNTILLARRSEDHETRIKALELENAELRKEIERLRS